MIHTELTVRAMKIAYNAHHGAVDNGGMPYILHPAHVAQQMTTEKETAAALLHDVIEDTAVTADMLIAEGIPSDVVNIVEILTKKPDEDYFSYINRVATDKTATKVKLADLLHNCDVSRLPEINENYLQRLEKYKKAIEILSLKNAVTD